MQTPGNLPSPIPTISAFAGDLLRIVFIFPESFDMSGLSFALMGSFPTETQVVGSNFTVSISPDVTKKLPVVVDYYLVKAGKHILKGKIKPSKGSGASDPTVFRITQTADVIFAVQVDSLEVVAQLTEEVEELKIDTAAAREELIEVAARKIDNWQVDTKASADAFAQTLSSSCFIEVLADETQGGVRALYFWNTLTLQEPLLL